MRIRASPSSPFTLSAAAMSSSSPAGVALHSQVHLRQHHSHAARTRFYSHLVRESFTSRLAMFLCSILLTLIIISGIIILILWLSLRPHRPRFYLSSFSAPSLSIFSFNVSDRNPNSKIAIRYDDDVTAAVFYNNRQVATGVVQSAFYQPPKNTTEILGQLVAAGGQNVGGDATSDRVALRLELSSVVQFKLSAWDTHHHSMHVSCELAVGTDGTLLPEFQGERCSLYFG